MSITIILALDLASPKRRGLIIGLISTGYTTGIALGAVLAGFLSAALGWVCRLFEILTGDLTNSYPSASDFLDPSSYRTDSCSASFLGYPATI